MSVEFQDADFNRWLAEFPDQVDGQVGSMCETGDPYICFTTRSLCRPEDVEIIKRKCVATAKVMLYEYLSKRVGRIYWRIRPEFAVNDHHEVLEFDDNGPDVDFITNRRCVLDHNWKDVGFYCRLIRSITSENQKAA